MTPEDVQLLNLRDLTAVYRDGTTARWGGRLIESVPQALPFALRRRSLLERLLGDAAPREAVRGLLRFYGLLEIASLAALIPDEPPEDFRRAAHRHLAHPSVRQWYEREGPMLLPQLFRSRLEGRQALREEAPDRTRPLFQHLLGLYGSASVDEDVIAFLAAAHRRDDRVGALLHSLEREDLYLGRLVESPGEAAPVLHGFRKFVLYCIDMHRVVAESQDLSLFGAAVRWFHVDWLSEPVLLRGIVGDALGRMLGWRPREGGGEDGERVRAAFDRLERAVGELFSPPDLPPAWSDLVGDDRPSGWGQAAHQGLGA